MRKHKTGVTLIEMLVVVTIIALFTSLAGPKIIEHIEKARKVAARVQIDNFEHALVQYKLDTGTFPNVEQGLEALRPYLVKDIPRDPWGHEYVYKFPGEHGSQPD